MSWSYYKELSATLCLLSVSQWYSYCTELHQEFTQGFTEKKMELNEISGQIIGAAIEVHDKLGPGLLESAYQKCMAHELIQRGLIVQSEVPRPIIYKEIHLNHGYRLDILVERTIVVEIKTVEAFSDVHFAQLLTYLKLGNYKLGLLINFNVSLLKYGIKRIIN